MSANDKQIGGSHYVSKIQHWDFIEEYGYGYLEGCASKYIVRWRKKNGAEDLDKALHYVHKLRELHETIGRKQRAIGCATEEAILEFCSLNEVPEEETKILLLLFQWHTADDLHVVASYIDDLLAEELLNGAAAG